MRPSETTWSRPSSFFLALLLAAAPAARASHPLITEDTGVLGAGRWQLELHGERARDGADVHREGAAVLAHGVHDKVDLQLEVPSEGGLEASAKWRFFEQGGASLLLKPVVGRSYFGADFAAAREIGRLELIAHAGYRRNRVGGERDALRHLSGAALWGLTGQLRAVIDVSRDTNPDPASGSAIREVAYGFLYALNRDVDVGVGVKTGRSEPAADRSFVIGVKLRR